MSNKTDATFHDPSFERALAWLTTRQMLDELAVRFKEMPNAQEAVAYLQDGLSVHQLDSRRLVQ